MNFSNQMIKGQHFGKKERVPKDLAENFSFLISKLVRGPIWLFSQSRQVFKSDPPECRGLAKLTPKLIIIIV